MPDASGPSAPPEPRRARFGWQLAAIAVAGLVLRALYDVAIGGNHLTPGYNGDVIFYNGIATLIADGHGFVHPYAWRDLHLAVPTAEHPPLWPLVLAAAAKLGGNGILAERLVGAPIGAAVVVVAGLIGGRVGGPRVGLAAAGIAALHPLLVAADGSVMSETLYGLFVLLALLAALVLLERPSHAVAAALGASVGLAALSRGEGLLLIPLLVVPAAWAGGRAGRPLRIAAGVVAAVLVIAPWTIRNQSTFDRTVLVSTNDASTLTGANCFLTYHGSYVGFWLRRCRSVPRYRNEARQAAVWRREALRYARRHAGRLVAVVIPFRLLRTFDLWQPGRQSEQAEGRDHTVQAIGMAVYFLLLPFAAFGALLLRRRDGPLWVLLVPVGLVVIVTVLLYGYDRFRHAADLSIVILAAVGLTELIARRRGQRVHLTTP
jgi:4-amino-4-deoxy-L-arabinose transferase-like glycosyltransferase